MYDIHYIYAHGDRAIKTKWTTTNVPINLSWNYSPLPRWTSRSLTAMTRSMVRQRLRTAEVDQIRSQIETSIGRSVCAHISEVKAFLCCLAILNVLMPGCFAIYLLLLGTAVGYRGQAILTSHKIPFARHASSIWWCSLASCPLLYTLGFLYTPCAYGPAFSIEIHAEWPSIVKESMSGSAFGTVSEASEASTLWFPRTCHERPGERSPLVQLGQRTWMDVRWRGTSSLMWV